MVVLSLLLFMVVGAAASARDAFVADPCEMSANRSEAACRAYEAASSLLAVYLTEDGLFGETKPWISANGIETLCDYVLRTGGVDAQPEAMREHLVTMLDRGFATSEPFVTSRYTFTIWIAK